MGKLACLFPGQGSQTVGMGKDLFEKYDEARSTFRKIDEAARRSLSELCFQGPAEELKRTINTQPTIMAASLAAWQCYQSEGGPSPDYVAGHSLGEITALTASGALALENAVTLVEKRAALMEDCPKGSMAAVLKLDPEALEGILGQVAGQLEQEGRPDMERVLCLANYNTRQQLVISGSPTAVNEAARQVKEAGGRAIPLPVGGAFHSPLMAEAARDFSSVLEAMSLSEPSAAVVQNFDARDSRSTDALKRKLDMQMENPVRWYESVEYMIEQGVDTFVEIGPGNVLTGLVKKIDGSVKLHNVSDAQSLSETLEALAGAAV